MGSDVEMSHDISFGSKIALVSESGGSRRRFYQIEEDRDGRLLRNLNAFPQNTHGHSFLDQRTASPLADTTAPEVRDLPLHIFLCLLVKIAVCMQKMLMMTVDIHDHAQL